MVTLETFSCGLKLPGTLFLTLPSFPRHDRLEPCFRREFRIDTLESYR